MRLPGGAPLVVTAPRLAEAIAAEWQAAGGAKGGEMTFADTPLTRLAGTALERPPPRPPPAPPPRGRPPPNPAPKGGCYPPQGGPRLVVPPPQPPAGGGEGP